MGYKTGQIFFPWGVALRLPEDLSMSALIWACRPKPPLYGLSLRKSPIKKPRNIIRVGSGRQPDQTQLGSTKPNSCFVPKYHRMGCQRMPGRGCSRDCANQILKATLEINGSVLAEMEIPSAYLDTLPKIDAGRPIEEVFELVKAVFTPKDEKAD